VNTKPIIYLGQEAGETPNLIDAFRSQADIIFGQPARGARNVYDFGIRQDKNWRARLQEMEFAPELAPYVPDLMRTVNEDHYNQVIKDIAQTSKSRAELAKTSALTQLVVETINPINYVGIPLGTVKLGRSLLSGALATGMTEAAYQAFVDATDPTSTAEMQFTGILGATALGGAFTAGGTFLRNAAAYNQGEAFSKEFFDMVRIGEDLRGLSEEDIASAPARAERPLGAEETEALTLRYKESRDEIRRLLEEAEEGPAGQDLRDRAEQLSAEAAPVRQELGLRKLEDISVDRDPYSILSSKFTDSPLYKMVTTPMKRALQSTYPSNVKKMFVDLASDMGIALTLNAAGRATPPSVFQRSAVNYGRIVKAHDELRRLWADDTGASPNSTLEINFTDVARRLARSEDTYDRWLDALGERRIHGDVANMSEAQIRAAEVFNRHLDEYKAKLEDQGMLSTIRGTQRKIELLTNEIDDLQRRIDQVEANPKPKAPDQQRLALLKSRHDRLVAERKWKETELQGAQEGEPDEVFTPRIWDQESIRRDRAGLESVLAKWYKENPYVYDFDYAAGKWERKELDQSDAAVAERARQSVDRILGMSDPVAPDMQVGLAGRNKHFRSRQIDIPNRLVSKYMVRNPLSIMKAYAARVDPSYEFHRQFGGDINKALFELEDRMLEAGSSPQDINAARRDFKHLYDQIAGVVVQNPDALNQRIAFALKEAASFAYMGGSGLAAIPDFGRIVMEFGLDDVVKGVQLMMDKERIRMSVDETRIAGEAVDIIKQSAHARVMEDMSNNFQSSTWLNNARSAFYILNGLAPITTLAKQLAGVIDSHTIIQRSLNYDKLSESDRLWMNRYGIDKDLADRIAKAPWQKSENGMYMANTEEWVDSIFIPEIDGKRVKVVEATENLFEDVGKWRGKRYVPAYYNDKTKTIRFDREYIEGPMFEEKAWLDPKVDGVDALPDIFKTPRQWANFVMLHEINHTRVRPEDIGVDVSTKEGKAAYENHINKLALDDYKAAKTINEDTVERFRVALNSGVMNTIMHGTPADKPILTGGVAYIPMRVAKQFGMKEDSVVKGYARIENGLMALPFQFYSFLLATVNKTMGSMAQGTAKNAAVGSASMLGLAYMVLQYRTPDYAWNQLSIQDKAMRTLDMSGLLSIYSDMLYTGMHTALALGFPNITGGALSPKYNQEKNVADAVAGIAGAGPSWALDVARGVSDMLSGEVGEGARQLINTAPFQNWMFINEQVNQVSRGWGN